MIGVKTALVTGGSRGIGSAIVRALSAAGFKVVINYHSQAEKAEKLAKEVGGIAIQADVANEIEVKQMIEKIIVDFGRIDVLVNNAGIAMRDFKWSNIPHEQWNKIIDTNVWSAICCSRECVPYMIENEGGKIMNISSIHGISEEPKHVIYSLTKSMLGSITRMLAKELPACITINEVAPGNTYTDMALSGKNVKEKESKLPHKRFCNPEEIADTVAFLASDKANMITGQTIAVDGGQMFKAIK